MKSKDLLNAMMDDGAQALRLIAMAQLKDQMMNDEAHSHPAETAEDAKYWRERCIDMEVLLVDLNAHLRLMREAAMTDVVEKMVENPMRFTVMEDDDED